MWTCNGRAGRWSTGGRGGEVCLGRTTRRQDKQSRHACMQAADGRRSRPREAGFERRRWVALEGRTCRLVTRAHEAFGRGLFRGVGTQSMCCIVCGGDLCCAFVSLAKATSAGVRFLHSFARAANMRSQLGHYPSIHLSGCDSAWTGHRQALELARRLLLRPRSRGGGG